MRGRRVGRPGAGGARRPTLGGALWSALLATLIAAGTLVLLALAVVYDVTGPQTVETLYNSIFARLLELSLVRRGDRVILTKGELSGVQGGTNSMQILQVA